MTTKTWDTNYRNSKDSKNSLFIEMNEASREHAEKELPFQSQILQPQTYFPTQAQRNHSLQGSMLSLGSKSYVDQSDVQPLTEIHACRYDECIKFHNLKTDKKAPDSPFSPLKNLILYLVIILLIFWIIIYTVLTKLGLL